MIRTLAAARYAIGALLLLSTQAFAQQGVPNTIRAVTAQQTVLPNATIRICMPLPNTASNTPCSSTKSVFSDVGLSSPLANPVTADANGYATFYLDSLGYSYSVYDSAGTFQFTGYAGSATGALQYGVVANTIAQGNDSRIVNALNTGVSGAAANGTTNDAAAINTACSAGKELYLTAGASYLVGTSEALACNLHPNGATLIIATGVTLTLNGGLTQGPKPLFTLQGNGAVSFGVKTSEVYPEWFGAVADSSFTGGGTDDTVPLQKALNSLTAGHVVLQAGFYRVSSALSITRSNIGIRGTHHGYSYPTNTNPSSIIISSSASADVIDISGTTSLFTSWNDLRDFSVERSVAPTGTAAGISSSFTIGLRMDSIQIFDSIREFYLHQTQAGGAGIISNCTAQWGANGLTPSGTLYGFYLDSADGNAENTIIMDNDAAGGSGNTATVYGLYMNGSAINDVDIDQFGSSGTTWGIYINFTGGTANAGASSDIHIRNPTIDGFVTGGIYINGVAASSLGSVDIDGGWVTSINSGTTHAIDLESSSGINIRGVQIINRYGDGIYAHNTTNGVFIGNTIQEIGGSGASAIELLGSSWNSVTGNSIRGDATYPTSYLLAVVGNSTYNSISGNVLSGYGTDGIITDGGTGTGSVNNQWCANAIDPANIATPAVASPNYNPCGTGGGTTATFSYGAPSVTPALDNSTLTAVGSGATTAILSGQPVSAATYSIELHTGTGTTASAGAQVLHVHYPSAWSTVPNCTAYPESASAALAAANLYVAASTTDVYLVTATTTPLTASTTYDWNFQCRGN